MKLLFDLLNSQPAEGSKFHGGGEYIKTVFKKLAENSDDTEITVFYDFDRFLDDWIKEIISKYSIRQIDLKSEQDIQTINEPFDVFYSGLPYKYKREWIPEIKRFIGTIHGLRGLEKPDDEYDYMYEDKPYLLAKAKKQLKKTSIPFLISRRKNIKASSIHSEAALTHLTLLFAIPCTRNTAF